MIRRKALVGLSLLCALAFCAFAAPNASASGTTAFTCVENQGEKDFTDAHCDNQVKAGSGKFGHVKIESKETAITVTNEKTASETKAAQPFILTGKLSGVEVAIECKVVNGSGTLTNEETKEGMKAVGGALLEASKCSIASLPKCTVKEPIVWDAHFTTYQSEAAMGLEFTPTKGTTLFGSWTLTGSECAIKNTFTIEGWFQGTPGGTAQGKGATVVFTKETTGNLKWGGATYTLTGAITLRMKEGNPITFTT